MALNKLLNYLAKSDIELKPRGTTSVYIEGKALHPKTAVKEAYEFIEGEIENDNYREVTSYVVSATEGDGKELIARLRGLIKKRARREAEAHIGGLDTAKSFKHKGLTPIRDIKTGKRGLFDSNKDRIAPLDYETWYDKLPIDKDQRSLILENEILGIMEYNPYTLQSKDFIDFEGQEIYRFNSHLPPAWRFSETEEYELPTFFIDFMEHLIPDKKCRIYTISWMNEMIFGRNETILTMVSTKGTGKNIFMEVCEKLVGELNFQIHSEEIFKSQFMGELENKRVVALDETPIQLKYKDRLKRITNGTISIERKGKDVEIGKKNHASFIIANNVHDGNHLDSDDRRFSVIDITEHKLLDRFEDSEVDSFVRSLRENPKVIHSIGRYIMDNCDPEFQNHIPYKGAKFYELRYWSLPQWKRYLVDLITERKEEYYPMEWVKAEYEERTNIRGFGSNNSVQKFLDEWRDFDGDKLANIDEIEGDMCLNPQPKYKPKGNEQLEEYFDI